MTLFILLLFSLPAQSQKLTGIWRGYFSSSSAIYQEGVRTENYKYEIQVEQSSNNSIHGVTYSYKTTVFYGKATIQGIYSPKSKSLIFKETHMVDLKVTDNSEPCLMTCYLDYSRIGKLEILQGTFISVNAKDKGDCGSGKVYLEKVPTSDFELEDFLAKKSARNKPLVTAPRISSKKPETNSSTTDTKPALPNKKTNSTATAKPQINTTKKSLKEKSVANPPKSNNTVITQEDRVPEKIVNTPKKEEAITVTPEKLMQKLAIPRVLLERENKLVKTITTSEDNIQIALYDNGTIDNDTISVYHNNQLVISNGRLSNTPIQINIHCTKTDNRHEFVMVAENLGEIPPNTALMVITAGRERYEVFLSSDESRNAKVIINYVPKE